MSEPLQFIDLKAQYRAIGDKINARIHGVLDHGRYILGPEVAELEQQLGEWTNTTHAVGVANGTDALVLALRALDIGPGDAVITSSFSFFASAESIALVGATPVFADIEMSSYNMCPDSLAASIDAHHNKPGAAKLRAVIAVDLFGLPADYERIVRVAKDHGLQVIEDGAQSFGARRSGAPACGFGDIATTSFFPAKPLGCYGDGGAVFSHNEDYLAKVRSLRVHGKGTNKYDNVAIGTNSRLDTLQAAILLEKLAVFAREIELRNAAAANYSTQLADQFHVPEIPDGAVSTWAQYCLRPRHGDRDTVLKKMKDAGLPSAVYYQMPLHLQPAMAYLGYKVGDFPTAEKASGEIFSIPMHPYLDEPSIERITNALID